MCRKHNWEAGWRRSQNALEQGNSLACRDCWCWMELPLNCTVLFMFVWKDTSSAVLEGNKFLEGSWRVPLCWPDQILYWGWQRRCTAATAVLCIIAGTVVDRKSCLSLTSLRGNAVWFFIYTLSQLLQGGHDNSNKYFTDNAQEREREISLYIPVFLCSCYSSFSLLCRRWWYLRPSCPVARSLLSSNGVRFHTEVSVGYPCAFLPVRRESEGSHHYQRLSPRSGCQ